MGCTYIDMSVLLCNSEATENLCIKRVYLQETLEDPALQRASPILALTLYLPTLSPALSVLPSIPALYLYTVTSDRV